MAKEYTHQVALCKKKGHGGLLPKSWCLCTAVPLRVAMFLPELVFLDRAQEFVLIWPYSKRKRQLAISMNTNAKPSKMPASGRISTSPLLLIISAS